MTAHATPLIAFAAPPGPRCREAIAGLKLDNLNRLLQQLVPTPLLQSHPQAMTPLHERLMASADGQGFSDGLMPWAARQAQSLGLAGLHGTSGWARITPCHWTVQADHVQMDDPAALALTSQDHDALWASMEPYFSEDGITLFAQSHESKGRYWLARGAVFRELPTASLDRVASQRVDPWMPRQAQARPLRKLQNEMQMLLYHHAVNDERERYKLPSVNSFWVSGTGSPDDTVSVPTNRVLHTELRASALKDDPQAWAFAWHALDETLLAPLVQRLQAGASVDLILAGQLQAVRLGPASQSLMERLRRRFQGPQALLLLNSL
ncbi:MAG: hypothetical protein CFE44_01835 [Burkholderiales bacterium PBB4]|nr:MAG: hypothetical protein CFE44_01835 [Burkholderiales bacterium PBB4]